MTENKRSIKVFPAALIGIFLLGALFVPMLKNIYKPATTEIAPPTQAATVAPTPLAVEIVDARGVTMRLIPAGDFTMGSYDDMAGDAQPSHTVTLPDFYMDVYEVTRARYRECVTAGVCSEVENVASVDSFYAVPNYPMSSIDWEKAKAYCEAWRGAHLPSEAEWEKAARGTDGRTYPWGEEFDSSYVDFSGDFPGNVGSYEKGKSPYGMYDMAGSVWEWTSAPLTVYPGNQGDHSYYRETDRVLRGGSWNHPDRYVLTTWFRFASSMGDNSGYVGFRCAKDAP
ncbi:MAG: SUMF1/EgtB/PvdO family nonheme iron enzyme [Chloroflexi bacterium]|nr:SUMF1/EgtB/PvdO family nonheme iron enzyme [Chloroflexota bacterium]